MKLTLILFDFYRGILNSNRKSSMQACRQKETFESLK